MSPSPNSVLKEALPPHAFPFQKPSYLQVHLSQADQHPCYEPLPEANRDEAHLKHPLDGVSHWVPHAVGVQPGFGWKEVG